MITRTYFTNLGPSAGPFLWRDTAGAAIGVLESSDEPRPIGMASPVAAEPDGVALWKLTVRGSVLPGRWVVVDRVFRPAQDEGREPRG